MYFVVISSMAWCNTYTNEWIIENTMYRPHVYYYTSFTLLTFLSRYPTLLVRYYAFLARYATLLTRLHTSNTFCSHFEITWKSLKPEINKDLGKGIIMGIYDTE
jgi:hypothetical protein